MKQGKLGYKRERAYVLEKYGQKVETCHVADVKASLGLTRGQAHNRISGTAKVKPCPPDLWPLVEEAVRHVHAHRLSASLAFGLADRHVKMAGPYSSDPCLEW